jgi:hypothetical protein
MFGDIFGTMGGRLPLSPSNAILTYFHFIAILTLMTMNIRLLSFILLATLTFPAVLTAQSVPLLSQTELDPYGFKRVWFHQLKLRSADGKIQHILLEGEQIFITTSDSYLHVLHAETGEWQWTRSIGNRASLLSEPAVNSRIVALHNNLSVFLFNRKTGKELLQIPLPAAPSAPCEMSEHYLYVPMVNQTILGYVLRESFAPEPADSVVDDNFSKEQGTAPLDPEWAKIVKQFEDAKNMFRDVEPQQVNDDFVLDSKHRIPITTTSFGTLRTQPLLLSQFYDWKLDDEEQPIHEIEKSSHKEFLAWITEDGFLYTAKLSNLSDNSMTMLYRVNSAGQTFFMNQNRAAQNDQPGNKALVARPTQSQLYPVNELDTDAILSHDVIVAGGRAAYVFAIDARSGNVCWQYPAQGQLLESIAIIGKDVYAPIASGGLHALDIDTGKERWFARGVKRFVAASKERVYVLDMRSRLVGLDRKTGASLFVYDIRRFDHCLYNLETDQIILATNGGLIQCIRERQFQEQHSAPEQEAPKSTSLRHRIGSAEFAKIVRESGGQEKPEQPKLWWIKDSEE